MGHMTNLVVNVTRGMMTPVEFCMGYEVVSPVCNKSVGTKGHKIICQKGMPRWGRRVDGMVARKPSFPTPLPPLAAMLGPIPTTIPWTGHWNHSMTHSPTDSLYHYAISGHAAYCKFNMLQHSVIKLAACLDGVVCSAVNGQA